MPKNDRSEVLELQTPNEFDIQRLRTNGKLKDAQNVDLARQLKDTFALLKESRDLLEAVKDQEMQNQAQDLIKRIDVFYPRA